VEFRVPDHIGGIAHDTARDRIVGLNWGSRIGYSDSIPIERNMRKPSAQPAACSSSSAVRGCASGKLLQPPIGLAPV
jgi:hypothetical protein